MADAGPRGAIAIGQVHLLDSGRLEDLRFLAESNIDDGLTQWYRIDKSALRPALNVLSGSNVIPEYECMPGDWLNIENVTRLPSMTRL